MSEKVKAIKVKFKGSESKNKHRGNDYNDKPFEIYDGQVLMCTEARGKQLITDFPRHFSETDEEPDVFTVNLADAELPNKRARRSQATNK